MKGDSLFEPTQIGSLSLGNCTVMSPMTRNRCTEANTPNDLMVEYYRQRAGAGLIVTEGTSPSPNGVGCPRIPGILSARQVGDWKRSPTRSTPRGGGSSCS
jgi:N-ethylmaleimide reductase